MNDQNGDRKLNKEQNRESAIVARYVINLDKEDGDEDAGLNSANQADRHGKTGKDDLTGREVTLISSAQKPVQIRKTDEFAEPSAEEASHTQEQKKDQADTASVPAEDSSKSSDEKKSDAGKKEGKRKVRLDKNFRRRMLTEEREEPEEREKPEEREETEEQEEREKPEEREELSEEELDREQMKWALKSRLRVYGLVAAIVLAFVLAAFLFGNFFRYQGYSSLASVPQASTASTNYTGLRDAVLTYDGEGASLMDLELNQIWNVQYTISSPAVSIKDDSIAIYDKQGSTIVLCDRSGERGTVTTSYPLIKAKVSEMGSVAAIEKDGEVTWLEYFNPDGSRVASVRTSMDSVGYPLDMAVSNDGMVLAVSYIAYEGEQKKGLLDFYQFGSTGQNQVDNRVAEFEYKDHFFPQVEFLGENRCIAFRDNGFSVFTSDDVPAKVDDVVLEDKIASVAYDESEFAILSSVTDKEGSTKTQVTLYNLDGRKIRDFDAGISYNTVEMDGSEIDFYADSHLTVYSTAGVRKFDGTIEDDPGSIFSVGNFRFGVVTDDSLNIVKLH
ncbi:MAG: DUF5711 family protein [Eubacterium sp.]|nr:DUF5711 family protein [Eubacterium sp.]